MRALLNYTGARTEKPGQWRITFLAEDARTPIGRPHIVKDLEALERLIDKMGGSGARARTDIYNWGQGSEWVNLSEAQCRFFGITYASGASPQSQTS